MNQIKDITDTETLYIIGNGFDIAHGIRSSYEDFSKWLKINYKQFHASMPRYYNMSVPEFWFQFEEALGEINDVFFSGDGKNIAESVPPSDLVDILSNDSLHEYNRDGEVLSQLFKKSNHMYPHLFTVHIACSALKKNQLLLEKHFVEWVNSLNIDCEPFVNLSLSNSHFITFNYTETLQLIYSIPENSVTHLHGKRIRDLKLTFGHDENIDYINQRSHDKELHKSLESVKGIIENILNNNTKYTYVIIDRNEQLWAALVNVKSIYVLGHSLNKIDMPYIKKIYASVSSDCKWHILNYGDCSKRKKYILEVLQKIGIIHQNINIISKMPT